MEEIHKVLAENDCDGLGVKPGKKFGIAPRSGSRVGLYVADGGKPVAARAVDVALAANSSAAPSLLPPAILGTPPRPKELMGVMVANLPEITNVCSRLLMTDRSAHLKLDRVYLSRATPPKLTALLGAVRGRGVVEPRVPKHGTGTLAVRCG